MLEKIANPVKELRKEDLQLQNLAIFYNFVFIKN